MRRESRWLLLSEVGKMMKQNNNETMHYIIRILTMSLQAVSTHNRHQC